MREGTDLRVVKTRRAIKQAFERLLETTDYTDITVSAVSREADISRKTFYAHYESVDALLREMLRDAFGKVIQELSCAPETLKADEWASEFARILLLALRDNASFDTKIVSCLSTAALLEIAREPLLEVCSREAQARGVADMEGLEYYLAYYLGGLFSVYEAWVASGKEPAELDRAALLIGRVAAYGFVSAEDER